MSNELKGGGSFDYKELDATTEDFLRTKETNMREIVGKAYTELGRELTEARDRLAGSNQYDGVFEKWYTTLGFNRKMVNRLIQRYELVVTNCHKQDLIEDLPVSLTYDIAKPSAESTPAKAQAKAEVLAGEIDTGKAYEARIAELEGKASQADKTAQAERKERERLEQENAELAEKANKPAEVRYETKTEYQTEYIEVRDEDAERRLREYEEKFGDLRNYDEKVTATHRQDMLVAVMSLSKGVKEFVKRYSYMTKYYNVVDNLDDESKQQYDEAINALKDMAQQFEFTSGSNDIIDAVYSEIN